MVADSPRADLVALEERLCQLCAESPLTTGTSRASLCHTFSIKQHIQGEAPADIWPGEDDAAALTTMVHLSEEQHHGCPAWAHIGDITTEWHGASGSNTKVITISTCIPSGWWEDH